MSSNCPIFAGGAIVIHLFGAFFGLAVSIAMRNRDMSASEAMEGSSYVSDVTAMLGTVILWIFWPSFNGILVQVLFVQTWRSKLGYN